MLGGRGDRYMAQIDICGKNIFFIGIGGSSMSGLALLLKNEGFNVSGSDTQRSVKVEHLIENGIDVRLGHCAENIIQSNAETIVYTAAIHNDNPELSYAREHGICCLKRSELVGRVMSCYKNAVGISGTKGKTTTTALLSTVLMECGRDPSALIGGTSKNIGSNVRIGKGDTVVAEACEYQDSFLDFNPTIAVILNVELEHTDYFKSMEQLKDSFRRFALKTPSDTGIVIGCADCEVTSEILGNTERSTLTYAINSNADFTAKNISEDGHGRLSFELYFRGEYAVRAELMICGRHNVYNALAVFAVAYCFGISFEDTARALRAYKGTGRRFDYYGSVNGAAVYDDYAHTPDEYRAVISAARGLEHNRLICIFQPHTYSRSLDFFDETVDAFDGCDEIIMLDIYAAREKDEGKIHSRDFERAMKKKGMNASYMPDYTAVADYMEKTASNNDIILVIGAGHSNVLCEMIAARGVPTDKPHGD